MTDGNGNVAKMGALTIAALETDAPNHADADNIIIIFQNMIRGVLCRIISAARSKLQQPCCLVHHVASERHDRMSEQSFRLDHTTRVKR